ncbi:MAG: DUF835 domain-containing protein [Candidatus Thermoplasmatota archaeon]|nr:DUF835 domain-containing protein [Candidatus Thermoplasmatota archaeon]MBU4072197.1 DUF835 domain-containing protein [Candidatus Thermoplasmatota archaeon]MBU4144226.1 DUF835 domain-containing protein [Candidatus Thermoplasmatota archaeon]
MIAIAIAALICIPAIPQNAVAQSDQNLIIIKTDYQMLGLAELHGGGHLTYELRGTAARDLRRAVLDFYDNTWLGTINGTIDSRELRSESRGYIDHMENVLETNMEDFFAGYTISFAPLYRQEDISVSATGFTTVTDVQNDVTTPIRIFLYFNAGNSNIPYDFRMMSELFIDALFHEYVMSTGFIDPNGYTYQYKHTDYRVSAGSFSRLDVNSGKFHIVRTPAGEIAQYSVTFKYNEIPINDMSTFKPFDFFENPQLLFALVFICGYVISTVPTRMYANYKFTYPRKFRSRALKITWLHIGSKIAIVILILLYFFPTMFGFISPKIFLGGTFIWIIAIAMTVTFVALAKVLYDKKTADISKEELDIVEKKIVRKPAPIARTTTRTPAGVNVVVQQPAAQQAAPAPVQEKPTGPPCVVCKKSIVNFDDLLKCKCGQLYHEECAEVAKHCTKCGNALVEIVPVGPVKKDIACPTCAQMNSVEEGVDLLLVECGSCGVIMEKINEGYNYLVVDNDHTTAFKMFVSLLKNGCTGLSISTTFPDKLKKEHDMETCEVIWLTDTSVADKKTINPHRLEFEMMRMYAAFVKSNSKSAIILDGFEYLVVENGFDKVFKFIKKINDLSSVNNATLIVPIGTSSLELDQLGTLKKEFDKVIDMVGNGDD